MCQDFWKGMNIPNPLLEVGIFVPPVADIKDFVDH